MTKKKRTFLIILLILGIGIAGLSARWIFWALNPPKIGEPKDKNHTTANDKTIGKLDYLDGYLYLLKDNNVIKVRTDGTDRQILRPFNIPIPFIHGDYVTLRIVNDQIYLKGCTWSASEKMRIDGKLWDGLHWNDYHQIGSIYSDGYIYNYGKAITRCDTKTGNVKILWNSSDVAFDFDHFVLCNEWLFFSENNKTYKVKTDGSEQAEELPELSNALVRFSEGNTVYFSSGTTQSTKITGLKAYDVYSGEITTINNDDTVLSYADSILIIEDSQFSDLVHCYLEYEGKRINMPDDFQAKNYLISNKKVYYVSGKGNDIHLKSVDIGGNNVQII